MTHKSATIRQILLLVLGSQGFGRCRHVQAKSSLTQALSFNYELLRLPPTSYVASTIHAPPISSPHFQKVEQRLLVFSFQRQQMLFLPFLPMGILLLCYSGRHQTPKYYDKHLALCSNLQLAQSDRIDLLFLQSLIPPAIFKSTLSQLRY